MSDPPSRACCRTAQFSFAAFPLSPPNPSASVIQFKTFEGGREREKILYIAVVLRVVKPWKRKGVYLTPGTNTRRDTALPSFSYTHVHRVHSRQEVYWRSGPTAN